MAANHLVGIERLRRQRLLPCEGKQPSRQCRGALAGDGGGIEKTLDSVVALAMRRLTRSSAPMMTPSILLKS